MCVCMCGDSLFSSTTSSFELLSFFPYLPVFFISYFLVHRYSSVVTISYHQNIYPIRSTFNVNFMPDIFLFCFVFACLNVSYLT